MEITRVPSRCQSTWKSFQKLSKKGAGSLIKHSSTLATDQCRLGGRGWRLHYPPDRFTAPKLEISAPRETCGLDKEDDVYQIQDLSPHQPSTRLGVGFVLGFVSHVQVQKTPLNPNVRACQGPSPPARNWSIMVPDDIHITNRVQKLSQKLPYLRQIPMLLEHHTLGRVDTISFILSQLLRMADSISLVGPGAAVGCRSVTTYSQHLRAFCSCGGAN